MARNFVFVFNFIKRRQMKYFIKARDKETQWRENKRNKRIQRTWDTERERGWILFFYHKILKNISFPFFWVETLHSVLAIAIIVHLYSFYLLPHSSHSFSISLSCHFLSFFLGSFRCHSSLSCSCFFSLWVSWEKFKEPSFDFHRLELWLCYLCSAALFFIWVFEVLPS